MTLGSFEVREFYSQDDFRSANYENSRVMSRCATEDQASQEVNYWESMGIPERMLFYVDRNDCRVAFVN